MTTKVLLIDDDTIYQVITSKTLKKLDNKLEVFPCLNGKIGLETLLQKYTEQERFVLLLDLNMPVLDGWEFIHEFEKLNFHHNSNIDIYIISSSTDQIDITKAHNILFIKEFLSKPVAVSKFEKILNGNS